MHVSQLGHQSLLYFQLGLSSLAVAPKHLICYTLACKGLQHISEVMR